MTPNEERYWNILQTNLDFIRFSETKAGLLITVYGFILSLLFANLEAVREIMYSDPFIAVACIADGLIILLALFYAFRCINPRLKITNSDSIVYFGNIAKTFSSPQSYFEASQSVLSRPHRFEEQLAHEIHINAVIARKKFTDVTFGLRFFALNFVLTAFIVVLYLIV